MLVSGREFDFEPLTTTSQFRQFSIHVVFHVSSPYLNGLSARMLWEAVANTSLKKR